MVPAQNRRGVAIAPYTGNELTTRSAARAVHDDLIEQSHLRCAALGLSRIEHPDHMPLMRSDLSIARERNQRLSTHAAPVMEMLFEQIVNTESMIVLTDATGTILYSVGDHDFLARADKVALVPGVNWAEHSKGTNAIGTALFEERATLVHGGEHFMHANSFLTCSATPIFDPRGNMLGVLDVTGDQRSYHRHTMGLVRMSARMIENHWLSDDYGNRLRLHFHSRVEFIGTLLEGIVVVGGDGRILGANRSALDQLSTGPAQLRTHTLTSLFGTTIAAVTDHFRRPLPMPMRLSTPGGQQFHVDARLSPATRPNFVPTSGAEPQAADMAPASDPRPIGGPGRPAPADRIDGVATRPAAASGLNWLLTGDAQIAAVVGKVRRTLNLDIPLLLLGETGTGKELFARAVHQESQRARQPFVAVDLSALTPGQVDVELFGCIDSAAGPRRTSSSGRIVQANGGTLFLHEIGALPPETQLRLLGVLQDRCVTPIGGRQPIVVDIAIVCASRRDLRHLVHAQAFREDLYYRLNGLVLRLPPLRERSDLGLLVQRSLQQQSLHTPPEISPSVMDMFKRYAWPGNVRQLANVLRTAALMCGDERLVTEAHLSDDFLEDVQRVPPALRSAPPAGPDAAAPASGAAPRSVSEPAPAAPLPAAPALAVEATLEATKTRLIRDVLAQVDGNISEAAKRLGISRNTVYRKLRRLADEERAEPPVRAVP